MASLLGEAAGNGHGFVYGQVPSQFILSRARHLTRSQEVGLVKILQGDSDFGLAQKAAVSVGNRFLYLGDGEPFRQQSAGAFEGHEAIRLHGQGLIEFGRKSESYVDGIRPRKPIKRMAFLSACRISNASRLSGLRDPSIAGTAGAGRGLALRALRRRDLAGGRSRSRRRCRRGGLSGRDQGGLQDEHACSSQNDVSSKYIHLRTLAVALNGALSSSDL